MKKIFILLTLFTILSCSSNLTQDTAKKEIEKITQNAKINNVLQTSGIHEWKGVIKFVNENEKTMEAVVNINRNGKLTYRQNTIFRFKKINGNWILNGGSENVRLGSGISSYRSWLNNLYVEL